MENCCDSLMKYLLFIINFFFFLTGIALISMGSYIQAHNQNYLNFLGDDYLNTTVLFIVVGVSILIVGFFGCCGACTENSCMVFTYATLLAIIVIAEIGIGIALFVFEEHITDKVSVKMIKGLRNYDPDPESEFAGVKNTWDHLQKDFACCGVKTYRDWENATKFQDENPESVPDSCCKEQEEDCGKSMLSSEDPTDTIYANGCMTSLVLFVKDSVEIVGGIIIAIILLQVVGVLVSCMLANNMRRNKNYV